MNILRRFFGDRSKNINPVASIGASRSGNKEAEQAPPNNGARTLIESPKAQLDSRDSELMEAAGKGNLEAVKSLLDNGANLKARELDGHSALWRACGNNHVEIARLLIDHGGDVNEKNEDDYTLLMSASENYRDEIAQLLLERGADVNAKTRRGSTAASLASARGCTKVMEVLEGLTGAGSKPLRRGGRDFTNEGLYCPICDKRKAVRGIWFRERESINNLARRKMAIASLSNSGHIVSDEDYYVTCVLGHGTTENLGADSGGGSILWFR